MFKIDRIRGFRSAAGLSRLTRLNTMKRCLFNRTALNPENRVNRVNPASFLNLANRVNPVNPAQRGLHPQPKGWGFDIGAMLKSLNAMSLCLLHLAHVPTVKPVSVRDQAIPNYR